MSEYKSLSEIYTILLDHHTPFVLIALIFILLCLENIFRTYTKHNLWGHLSGVCKYLRYVIIACIVFCVGLFCNQGLIPKVRNQPFLNGWLY